MKEIPGHLADQMMSAAASAQHISIITHMKPDGDAMGSSTGLYHFLKANGCQNVSIILPSPYPNSTKFLIENIPSGDIADAQSSMQKASELLASSDLIFCLDFNSFHRTESLENTLRESKARKILIDHHLNPDIPSFSIVFSEIEISSASELLFHVLMKTSVINGDAGRLPYATAESLYTGMTTDTNNFNNSTYPSTLEMASELIAHGVDKDRIINEVMHSYKENRLRLIGHLLKDNMTIIPEGGACMVIDSETIKQYNIGEGETEGIVNIPLDIKDVRLSILLKEDNGKARVSLRSKKGVSANFLAASRFNGGGHENASGGRLEFNDEIADISQAREYTIQCMKEFLAKTDNGSRTA